MPSALRIGVAFEIAYALKILAEIVFLEENKREKLGACLRGTGDGIRGRRGPIMSLFGSAHTPQSRDPDEKRKAREAWAADKAKKGRRP